MTLFLFLFACSGDPDDGSPAWALNTATVTAAEDGLSGAHTWTFYSSSWESSQSDDDRVCEIVQELTGSVVAPMEGCQGCAATYAIDLVEVVSDCSDGLSADPGLEALLGFAFGPVPSEVAEDDPHPDVSAGWYLTLDNEVMEGHGFAYPSALARDEEVSFSGWIAGETYILEPAYAWQL